MSSVFNEARMLSLVAWFERHYGAPSYTSRSTLRYHACPSCGEEHSRTPRVSIEILKNRWYCHRCSAKGDIIDAEQARTGVSAFEAAAALVSADPLSADALPTVQLHPTYTTSRLCGEQDLRQDAIELVARKLKEVLAGAKGGRYSLEANTRLYLTQTRKIPDAVVDEALAAGVIGFLPADPFQAKDLLTRELGRELLEAAGMWAPDKKVPAIAFKPLVTFMSVSALEFRSIKPDESPQFKLNQYGRGRHKYMHLPSVSHEKRAATLVEGVIDVLSARALGSVNSILGLPGCKAWSREMLVEFANRTGINDFVIAFDNDIPGETAATELVQVLRDCGFSARRYVPKAKDFNEMLCTKS